MRISAFAIPYIVFIASMSVLSSPSQAQSNQPPRPVVVAIAQAQDIAEYIKVTGTAEAAAAVEIRPEVTGRVTDILFTDGTLVKAGEPLVQLDSRAAQARRDQAKAKLDNVTQQLARARALKSGTAVTAARLDELQSEVDAARAVLREADVVLDQHTIRMPFDGMVGLRRISVGAQVTPASTLTTADDSQTLQVVFRLPDVWLATIKPGLPIQLTAAQDGETSITGTIFAIDSRVDSASRTIGIKATVANPQGLIKPGSMVRVEVPIALRQNAVTVPEQAILMTGQQAAVFVLDNGTAKRIPVELGLRQRGLVEIRQGLTPGQTVIAEGTDRLRDGATVQAKATLKDWETPAPSDQVAP